MLRKLLSIATVIFGLAILLAPFVPIALSENQINTIQAVCVIGFVLTFPMFVGFTFYGGLTKKIKSRNT